MLFFCFSSFLFSQDLKKIDSLQNELAKAKSDSVKVATLSSLFDEYIVEDIEKAKSYNDIQFEIARKSKDDYIYSYAFHTKGYYYFFIRKIDSALVNMKKSNRYAKKSGNSEMIIETNLRLGYIYNILNEYDSTLYYLNNTIKLSKQYNDKISYANAYLERGSFFMKHSKLDLALKDYLVTDSVLNKMNHKSYRTVSGLNAICGIYITLGDYKKAEIYGQRAKKMAEEVNESAYVFEAEAMLGEIDYFNKDYKNAEEKYKRVLENYIAVGNKNGEGKMLIKLGRVKLEQNELKKAVSYLLASLKILNQADNILNLLDANENLGRLYLKTTNYEKSKRYYNEALKIARENSLIRFEVNCLKQLAKLNYLTRDYKASSELFEDYASLNDSLNKSLNLEKVNELETKYDTSKKEQQIELLSAENELGKQRRKSQLTVFAAILGLLCIAGLALAFAYRNKIKTAEKIKELNAMKSRFFANISHEFRTPLTLIKSPLQTLQSELNDEKQQKQLSFIDKNSNRMLELVDQLLELSKIDSGKLKLILKEGNISSFLNSIAEPFEFRAKEKGQEFSSQIENQSENHFFDKDVIEKIVSNLLSNAEKYTPKGEKIEFHSNVENENLMITISNSGTNLKKQDLPKLFERFYQKSDQQQGFGIGLALIKELIDLYKGKIETSIENEVLSFQVSIPLKPNETENIVITKEEPQTIISQSTETDQDEELPVLLIADDNVEIRNVLKGLFAENYKVLEAENGKIALKIAQREIPDCIISDVMMPEMDGFEFTKSIKENELTSFIPVVLLTAKTSQQSHLKGLKSTADAFLTKPFNNEILKETVLHQIAERRKLRERYSRELILRPVDIAINSVDEKFLEKLGEVMNKQLGNTGFSTDEFASEVGMSRMQLHRKLKTLLNVSATEFIRNERLKTAAALMKKGNRNISEIAYTVGFNDLSYFSKSFKDLYGVPPSKYIED